MKRDPFPLQWPDGWKRTPRNERTRSRFGHRGQVGFAQARSTMLDELGRLGAANVVLTSDLPVRTDGLPYANGRAEDPGVSVWFVLADNNGNHQERVFACDRWLSHAENMHAIALSVGAMRGLDRWGMADIVTRAFSGFAALPASGETSEGVTGPAPPPRKRHWREVLGETFAPWPELDNEELLVLAKGRHRKLIQLYHPDRGGDIAIAADLNVAVTEAETELTDA